MDSQSGKQFDLSLAALPDACVDAALATEDQRFYLHPGVDLLAIGRAVVQNLRARGDIVSGGSTITQQVARNLLMEPEERTTQSVRRKLREAWLALRLELRYSKDEILTLYLNQTYYGNFAFGLGAASQVFFSKPAAQLSRGECALLAGLVQYPSGYNPLTDPDRARARQLTVLRLMHDAGFISDAEQLEIAREPLQYRSHLFEIEAPHFVMMVQDELVRRLGIDRVRAGGLEVVTTLDLNLQQRAEAAVNYRLDLLNCRTPGLCTPTTDPTRRVDNAAAVVMDSATGDLLALVGSPDYFDESIQGYVNAALTLRQPGSAIKPLTYAVALDAERSGELGLAPLTPATILADLPATFLVTDETGEKAPYTPVNYDRKSHGPVSLRDALANSLNVPAVKVLDRIGVDALQDVAADAGITTFGGNFGLALTLGGGEVRLLELTSAYGALDDGRRVDPRLILTINGVAAGAKPGKGQQVIAPQTAWLITDILDDDAARLPAFGAASVLELPFEAAGKTGTTTDWRDNWTVGYTTQRLVGVWVGNADNSPMQDVSGVDGAGPIWRDLMLAAHDEPPPPFAEPEGIEESLICAPSGMLPSADCPRTRIEHFLAGSVPTQTDNQFRRLKIDRADGGLASAETPAERVEERVYWQLPPEYHEWMVGEEIAIAPASAPHLTATGQNVTIAVGQDATTGTGPLVLSAPVTRSEYRLHPGVPRANQRFEVSGYVRDGAPWAELRLVASGPSGEVALATAQDASRLSTWWQIEPGEWTFRLEGRADGTSATQQSATAFVQVNEFELAAGP
jgi:penicillin-binding protein 1C